MTLVEVIAAMVIILVVMVASTASFLEVQRVQETTNLRSQAHDLVSTSLVDYQAYPFDRLGIDSKLRTVSKANGGLGGDTVYAGEPIKYDTAYASSLVKHKSQKLIGSKQYEMTTYVTTPSTVANVDYQPVRVTLEINLGSGAGVVKDSKLVYPQSGACPPKRTLDTAVSIHKGCQ